MNGKMICKRFMGKNKEESIYFEIPFIIKI